MGELRSSPETSRLLLEAMEEIAALAAARGIDLGDDVVGSTQDYINGLPAEMTASMQRDIMEGRPSELETLNGSVVRLGRESGVATPAHRFIYAALAPMDARARRLAKP